LINYDAPASLKAFLDEHGLSMKKRFGQNFLINPTARRRLIDALSIEPEDEVWEIGPGLGAMTAELLERGASVKTFEIDAGFIRVLQDFFGGHPRFSLIPGDALKTWRTAGTGAYLLGNLPYTIAARLLGVLIEENRLFTRMVVTVQREVAQRMSALPGSKDYSSFSVLCASAYRVTPLMVLKGSSFYPVPHVDSQGVRLDLNKRSYPACFHKVVRRLFTSRRKTLKNNLRCFTDAPEDVLRQCSIASDRRAETLALEEFIALAEALDRRAFQ
jgi:16S rRNA (adenine1518-N6/adenine1519-N6)-dimethyltransferase